MIYSNLTPLSGGGHVIVETSRILPTNGGNHLNDVLIVSESGSGANLTRTPIDCDNGVLVCVKGYTGNGLQERYATICGIADKASLVASVPIIKDARSKAEEAEDYFFNKAGNDSRAYELEGDMNGNGDIFGVTDNAFTAASKANIAKDAYVVVDGNGKYVAQAAKPTLTSYGFVGQIHSIYQTNYFKLVRILVLQNVDNN